VFLKGWLNRITNLRGYLAPLLAKAPPGGETESALFDESSPDSDSYLRAGEPDFSALIKETESLPRAAE
jgi:hypothetical protein